MLTSFTALCSSIFLLLNTSIVASSSSDQLMGNPFLNLEEEFATEMVVTTKRIEVPGYPYAFNPAITRWHDKIILSFRVIPDRASSFTSLIGLILLNEAFEIISTPQILPLRDPASHVPSRTEDARLVAVENRLFIVYTDNPHPKITRGGFRMYVGELTWDGILFHVHDIRGLLEFEGNQANVREKNWVPFAYKSTLHLAYSLQPHTIFSLQDSINKRGNIESACLHIASTCTPFKWRWGILRGGTQADLEPALENKEYIAFFHSSIDMTSKHSEGKKAAHYFMGAYTFSATPPFNILKMSPSPIIGKRFYSGESYKPYWKPVKVVFPGGFIADSKNYYVAYGRDDHECWIATIDKIALLESLLPADRENTP